jgi:hypothetical protein
LTTTTAGIQFEDDAAGTAAGEIGSAFVLVRPSERADYPWLAGSPFPVGSPLTPWSFGSAVSVTERFAIWDSWEDLSAEFGADAAPATWPRYGRPHLVVATVDGGPVADWAGEFAGIQALDGRLASSRLVDPSRIDLQEGDWASDVVVRATTDAEPEVWVEASGRRAFAWGWAGPALVTVAAGEDGVTTALIVGPEDTVAEFDNAVPVALAPGGDRLALSVQSTTEDSSGLESVVVVDTATGEIVGEPFGVEAGISGRGAWSGQALVVSTHSGAIVLSVDEAGSLLQTASFELELPSRQYVIAATGDVDGVDVLVEGTQAATADEPGWFRRIERCDADGCTQIGSVTADPGEYVLVLDVRPEDAAVPVAMCVSIEPFAGGEPQHGTFLFGDAWPVLEDDLILNDGFAVTAFNDGEVRGHLLTGDFHGLAGPAVFVDGSGGLVVQGRFAITHVRADQTVVELAKHEDDDPWAFPGYELHGTAEIDGEWYAYATHAPANAYETGEGDLVLMPLDGRPERIVTQVVQEEGGATARFDAANGVFVLDWGSLGDRWITAVTPTGEPVELPWNKWETPSEAIDPVVVGVNGWQAYRGIHDSTGVLTVEGFDSATGDTVYPSTSVSTGPEASITRLLPLEDRLVVSASTPDGPCTRIFGPDQSFIDLPVRGHASPPVGLYGTQD